MGSPEVARQGLGHMLLSLQQEVSNGEDTSCRQKLERILSTLPTFGGISAEGISADKSEMEQVYQHRISRLEEKLQDSTTSNTKLRMDLQLCRSQYNTETERLQKEIQTEVQSLKERQDAVERARLQSVNDMTLAKMQLSSTTISDTKYAQLKQSPADQRSLVDQVKLVIYDGLQQGQREIEQLRQEAQQMREAQQRTVQDAAATRRHVDRLTKAEAEAVAERDQAAAAHNAEVQRLQHEAQQASLAAEINSAKAAQYDNMAAHAHRLEQELRQMSEQGPARLEAEQLAASLTEKLKERDHKLQLASMDSGYLKREVASLEARLQVTQQERDSAHAGATDAKARHNDLCSNVLLGDGDSRAALERRIDEEVARVREAARADVATVREEARAALERETRLLRDMRDRAQHDADTAAAEVKACRQQLDDAAVRFRSLQHKADVQGSTLAAELKIMAVDVDRAKMLAAEREGQVLQVQAHNDMLEEKVRVLTDTLCCHAAEAGGRPGAGAVQPSQTDMQSRSPSPAAHREDCSVDEGSRALRHMRKQRDALATSLQSAQQEAGAAKAEAQRVRDAQAAASPSTFLTQELRHAEERAEAASQGAQEARAQQAQQAKQLKACRKRLRAVQADLQSVLEQRRSFDELLERANMPDGAQHF